jgi:hypothetical protein
MQNFVVFRQQLSLLFVLGRTTRLWVKLNRTGLLDDNLALQKPKVHIVFFVYIRLLALSFTLNFKGFRVKIKVQNVGDC